MTRLEGAELGHCRLIRYIGGGGMGEVYLAEQSLLGRQVAVKVIRGAGSDAQAVQTPETQARSARQFTQEARAIAALEHPHILPLYDYGQQQGIHYLVMPYIPEGSLADLIAPGPQQRLALPLTPEIVAEIITQAAEALQFAHDRGVLHRDVKPGNLLVRLDTRLPGGTSGALTHPALRLHALLADFGLARLLSELSRSGTGTTGTPLYSAPEQYTGRPVPASDQYALACVAYLLLTGSPVFTGTVAELYHQHMTMVAPPASSIHRALAPAVDAALSQALAKDPAQRFPQIYDFAQALRLALLSGEEIHEPLRAASVIAWGGYQGITATGIAPGIVAGQASGILAPPPTPPMSSGSATPPTPASFSAPTAPFHGRTAAPPPTQKPAAIWRAHPDGPAAPLPMRARRVRLGRFELRAPEMSRNTLLLALAATLVVASLASFALIHAVSAAGGSLAQVTPIGTTTHAPTATTASPTMSTPTAASTVAAVPLPPTPTPLPPMHIEGESLLPPVAISAGATATAQANCCGVVWSHNAQLFFQGTGVGSAVTLSFNAPVAGAYDLAIALTKAPDYGILTISIDGKAQGQPFNGVNSTVAVFPPVDFGQVHLAAGKHQMTLTITGTTSSLGKYYAGLDYFVLRQVS